MRLSVMHRQSSANSRRIIYLGTQKSGGKLVKCKENLMEPPTLENQGHWSTDKGNPMWTLDSNDTDLQAADGWSIM